jgi:hypothetical protein
MDCDFNIDYDFNMWAELSQILLLFYHFHPVHALRYLFEQVYSRNSLFGSQRDQACYFDITECTSYPRCIIYHVHMDLLNNLN